MARHCTQGTQTMHAPISPLTFKTFADLQRRLGDVAPERIRMQPPPGTATIADLIVAHDRDGRPCELVEGVLVEKTVGFSESRLALWLGVLLNSFVLQHNQGIVTAADGTYELMPNLVRIPDLAFTSWSRMPGGQAPTGPVPQMAPNLAVEVLSQSNRPGESAAKRQEYFTAGVELIWEVNPRTRSVAVYTSPTQVSVLHENDTLDGGAILPGFSVPLQTLFAELDRTASQGTRP